MVAIPGNRETEPGLQGLLPISRTMLDTYSLPEPAFPDELALKLARCRDLLDAAGCETLFLRSGALLSWLLPALPEALQPGVGAWAARAAWGLAVTEGASRLTPPGLSAEAAASRSPGRPNLPRPWLHDRRPAARRFDCEGSASLPAEGRARLMLPLIDADIERYRRLGSDLAVVVTHAAFHLRPGMTDHQIAGMLAGTALAMGIRPQAVTAAVDDAAAERPFPGPHGRPFQTRAVLGLAGLRDGQFAECVRTVDLGPAGGDARGPVRLRAILPYGGSRAPRTIPVVSLLRRSGDGCADTLLKRDHAAEVLTRTLDLPCDGATPDPRTSCLPRAFRR